MTPDGLACWASGGTGGAYGLLADRPDGTVVRCGELAAKAHAPDSEAPALAARLRIAGAAPLAGILLPPLRTGLLQERHVSLWPYGTPVDPERPEDAPWEAAGRLLAALHRTPLDGLPGPVPPMRGPAKVARALRRLTGVLDTAPEDAVAARDAEGAAVRAIRDDARNPPGRTRGVRAVRAAARTLPAWARGEAAAPPGGALCHGDLHLGQLVRHPAPEGPWLLIDVDDLGLGTPAWDLARPAAWYAAGLLPRRTGSASSTPTAPPAARPPVRPAPTPGRNSTSPPARSPYRRPPSPWPRRPGRAADSTTWSG